MGLGSSIGGVVSGILNKGGVSAPDLTALFQTIKAAGTKERALINELPGNLQAEYQKWKDANASNLGELKTGTEAVENKYLQGLEGIYDPNAPAVKAAMDAAKTAIYADLPGQQDAIREALAATGGLDRGTASKQLAAPVIQAAAKYGQAVQNVTAQQLQQKQAAQEKAVNTLLNMDNNVVQQTFGMNKEQALAIMNGTRDDLKNQMTDLVNQSTRETQQTLGVQSADVQNKYNAAVANKAQKDALNNAWVNLGVSGFDAAAPQIAGFMQGMGNSGYTSAPANYNPGGSYQQTIAGLGY